MFKRPIVTMHGDQVTMKRVDKNGDVLYSVTVPLDKYTQWRNGALIQNVFPALTNEQREFMISGATPKEWNALFADED